MRIIQRYVNKQLVEFMDEGLLRRVWIPANVKPTLQQCRWGIEEGLTLGDIESLFTGLQAKDVAKRVLNSLRQQGIWTLRDSQRPKAPAAMRIALWDGFRVRPGDLAKLLLSKGG